MRKLSSALIAVLAAALIPVFTATTAQADDVCTGDFTIGMGGLTLSGPGVTGETSAYITSDQPVGYNSADPASGYNELDRLFWQHRNDCPDDHIRIVAHSEGAGIAHQWVEDHSDVGNANAILLADPKRQADGYGWDGLSSTPGSQIVGWPLSGVDDNFGDFPVLTVCYSQDMVCNTQAGWYGYLFAGAHGNYDFNAYDWGDWDSGTLWY